VLLVTTRHASPPPLEAPHADAIDLYTRTYYSLLRSSGDVRVRAFEEAHAYSGSSLHPGALSPEPDISAFAYAAARLPSVMLDVVRIVLGQSHELFEAEGLDVRTWQIVKSRGRRRPLRWNGKDTLAVFIASASDIDDLVPIVTAYQIEWNKMHARLRGADLGSRPPSGITKREIAQALGTPPELISTLADALGPDLFERGTRAIADHSIDLRIRMLAPSYSQYQRAAQRWWSGVEPAYVRSAHPRRGPVYFVSSNTHAIANLVGGYARAHEGAIADWVRAANPEDLAETCEKVAAAKDDTALSSLLYYVLRSFIHADPSGARVREVREYEAGTGLTHLSQPGHIDVDAQIVELKKIVPERLDPRLRVPGIERLAKSPAFLVNIDYPLGMAAYHLLSRVGQGMGECRGVYVMGKAATLNGRVGDVAISGTVYDEHTGNTFMFKNAFAAKDLAAHLVHGSVFDNQAALTVRSAFLQNKSYMGTFYREGYTVLEMEAGPFLSAVYELLYPTRVPADEIVHLDAPFDLGFLHYASDTPYSRRQSLLSKSLSYFGVDATYACAVAIVRRILEQEIAHLA
jgi:hypothetical protein